MKKNIILMGVKHCGKSTLGRLLAGMIGYRFIDIDDLLEELPIARGMKVKEIYKEKGVETFEEYEARAVIHFKQNMPEEPFVIAPGGGIIENPVAMAFLADLGIMIFLHGDPEEMFERIMKKGIPAFISGEKPYEHFLEIYKRRTKLYKKEAHIVLEIGGKTREEALELLLKATKGI